MNISLGSGSGGHWTDALPFHSSPQRLAGEKKITAIIIKQKFGFPMSTT